MRQVIRYVSLVLGVLTALPAFAGTMAYTTQASFNSAISGYSGVTTANFDSYAAGTVILTGAGSGTADGITFTATVAGGDHELVITDVYDTTSSPNYLGTTDPTTGGALFGSDSVTMGFASPVNAIGLYLLLGNNLNPGDFTLNIGGGQIALNSGTADKTLGDGTLAYFIGITDTSSFSSATISPTTIGGVGSGPLWNLDDITTGAAHGTTPPPAVPEPGTLLLVGSGLAALARRLRKA